LRDGVIVRLQQCADTAQLAKALGKNFQRGSDMTDVNPIGNMEKAENEAIESTTLIS
jgi:hypothetical protein